MASDERRDPMEARVITVSREALRADLAEMRKDFTQQLGDMELRMTRNLAELLARKADLAMHQELESRVRTIERDAIMRNGSAWQEQRAWTQEVEHLAQSHEKLVPEFRALQEQTSKNSQRILSETELRALARDERGKASGDQWSSVSKVIVLITTLVAILGLWLAWTRADASAQEGGSDAAPAVVVARVLD